MHTEMFLTNYDEMETRREGDVVRSEISNLVPLNFDQQTFSSSKTASARPSLVPQHRQLLSCEKQHHRSPRIKSSMTPPVRRASSRNLTLVPILTSSTDISGPKGQVCDMHDIPRVCSYRRYTRGFLSQSRQTWDFWIRNIACT